MHLCFRCLHQNTQNMDCINCGASLEIRGFKALSQLNESRGVFSSTVVLEVEDAQGMSRVMRMAPLAQGTESVFHVAALALGSVAQHKGSRHIPKLVDEFVWTYPDQPEKQYSCLVVEKVEGTVLSEYIAARAMPIDPLVVVDWLKQLLQLAHLFHSQNYLLQDIKPDNVLLKDDGTLVYVDVDSIFRINYRYMAEMGMAQPSVYTSRSPGFSPPEQNDGQLLPASDIFAIGRTMVYALTQRQPLDLYDDNGQFAWQDHTSAPSILVRFIEQFIALNPIDRPRVAESLDYVDTLPGRIRRVRQLQRFKWPIIAGLSTLIVGITVPLGLELYASFLVARGNQLQLDREFETALVAYERAIRFDSDNIAAHIGAGVACGTLADIDCGISWLEAALKLDPENSVVAFNLATLYESTDLARAERLYASVSEFSSRYSSAQNNLSRVLLLQGNFQAALGVIDRTLSRNGDGISPELKALLYKNKGMALSHLHLYSDAEDALSKAIDMDPLLGDAYCIRAEVYQRQSTQHSTQLEGDILTCLALGSQTPESRDIRSQLIQSLLDRAMP